jgi:hypothetical protein
LPNGVRIFLPKIPIWVYFGGPWNGKCWYISGPFGKPCCYLVYFGMLNQENLATLVENKPSVH